MCSMYIHYMYHLLLMKGKAFLPSLVEIDSIVLEKTVFKSCQCIFDISVLSSLGEGHGLSSEQNLNPLHPRILWQVWLKLAQSFMRWQKCEKFTNSQMDRQTTATGNQKSTLEPSAQVSWNTIWHIHVHVHLINQH